MGRRLLQKLSILALLLLILSACDSGVPPASTPITAPTATTASNTSTDTPTEAPADVPTEAVAEAPTEPIAEEQPTEEVAEVPTEAIAEDPTPAATRPPSSGGLPDGPLTLVALGDSLTQGDGDYESEGGGFPYRLERSINTVRPDSQVINLGESGWTSQQMVEGQLPQALAYNPNLAVVWIGSNNLWYNSGPEGEAQDIENYSKDLDTTFAALKKAGAVIFVALLDDQTLRPYATANDYANFTREQLAHMSQLTLKFNDVVRTKAAEYNATVVDFFNTTIFTDPATLAEDGIHPNSAGYDIIEKMWFDAIRRIL